MASLAANLAGDAQHMAAAFKRPAVSAQRDGCNHASVGGVDGIVGRLTIESPHPRLNWQVDPCMATTQIGRGWRANICTLATLSLHPCTCLAWRVTTPSSCVELVESFTHTWMASLMRCLMSAATSRKSSDAHLLSTSQSASTATSPIEEDIEQRHVKQVEFTRRTCMPCEQH
jgi:hypothetical protein